MNILTIGSHQVNKLTKIGADAQCNDLDTGIDAMDRDTLNQEDAPKPHRSSALGRAEIPIIGIFAILLLQALVWASDFLIPVTAAVLGYFVLSRPRRWLQGIGIPPVISAFFLIAILAVVVGLLLVQLSAPTADFIEDLPALMEQISEKLSTSGGTFEAINDATVAAENMIEDQGDAPMDVNITSNIGFVGTFFSMAPGFLGRILFALILLFFLVSSGDMFLKKTVQSLKRFDDKRRAVEVVRAIEDRLGYYLGGITLINAGLGVAVAVSLFLWGIPGAIIFGFMAFGLNFVPFLGGLFGSTIAAAVAFVSLDGTWAAMGVFATYMTLTSIEGQLITPYLISRRMRLNTTVVFMCVAFFAWIWSVMGMIVALPILIVVKIVCDETSGDSTLGRFLGGMDDDGTAKGSGTITR